MPSCLPISALQLLKIDILLTSIRSRFFKKLKFRSFNFIKRFSVETIKKNSSNIAYLPCYGKYIAMYRRFILNNILEALTDTPVIFLRGARQTGKSTLVQMIADGPYPANYVTLDTAGILSAAGTDPSGFIAGIEKPVVIDEAQRIPDLLLSIKEDVDRHRDPGRYILTGSADILTVPKVADVLVGRLELITLWPLSVAEIYGNEKNLVDACFELDFIRKLDTDPKFDLHEHMLAGGYPEPLKRSSPRRRTAWFDAYVSIILDRDIRGLSHIQDLTAVPRLLKLLASRVATLHNQSEISRSSGIPNSTLTRYLTLLKTTFLVQELPAWSTNLGKRLVKSPKLMMVDTGLACSLLGIDKMGVRQGGGKSSEGSLKILLPWNCSNTHPGLRNRYASIISDQATDKKWTSWLRIVRDKSLASRLSSPPHPPPRILRG